MPCQESVSGLLGFDLDAQTFVKAAEPTLDPIELGGGIHPDADVVPILRGDPKGLRPLVLRQNRPIKVPESGGAALENLHEVPRP
jgi:hypothetical protein